MWQSIAFPQLQVATGNMVKLGLGDLPPPPFLPTAWRKRRLAEVHRELRVAIPALQDNTLDPEDSDRCFDQCLRSTSYEDWKYWYQESALLKRYLGAELSDAASRKAAAVEKLIDANHRCSVTNRRFREFALHRDDAGLPKDVVRVLRRASGLLKGLLGEFPLNDLPKACGFTPGATTEYPRKRAALHNKWATASHVTFHALPYAEAFRRWAGLAVGDEFVIDNFNSVFTVPKDAWCDRAATRPVTWNGFLQKGTGRIAARRARRAGLLRASAQAEHRLLAKLGSATGLLSARDLKSASDNVALMLVAAVFPPSWTVVLTDLREPEGILPDGTTIVWEMLSTMGNGTTFEIETLLFWALVSACCGNGSLVSTYGDDIIFPQQYAERVDYILTFCGFTVNAKKSSRKGVAFMESCGGHFYQGRSIKPMYITNLPETLGDVINLHNDIVRITGDAPRPGTRWYRVFKACREVVPRVFWGPTGLQGVLWSEWDEARPGFDPKTQSFYVACVTRVADKSEDLSEHYGAYLQKLWCTSGDEAGQTSTYRETGELERGSWIHVYRSSWPLMRRVESLCD